MSSIQRRPWNSVSEQLYSISSTCSEGICNMNIATYVTPVTMHPKRYMIAVYRNTKTHENLFKTKKSFLLQAFSMSQAPLVKILGKKSGLQFDKQAYLRKKNVPHAFYKECMYLTESVFTLLLTPESYMTLDDHDLIIARFEKIVSRTNAPFLMTNDIQ